jgi:glycolate oxidase
VAVAELIADLKDSLPDGRVLTEPARLAPFESDALTAFRARPEAVVMAESREQVVDLVRLCHREGVPFVARGSGTSLSGGSLPVEGGIVIALNQLNRVLRIDADERTAVVEPGTINNAVSAAAADSGLFYAPDPSSQSICTIGGNLAFNSGGAHCLKHGMTSNHVLAIDAVLPDGEQVRLGTGGTEPAGPDWLGLFVGSEGLFGIALEVTLRLLPLPEATRTMLAAYPNLEAAGDAVAATIAAGILPVAMEIMDSLAIEAAESSVRPGYPKAPALLIVELDGERDLVESDWERLQGLIRDSGATEVRSTEDRDERALIWRGRKGAFSAVGWLSPDYIVQDGCVPRTRLGEALGEIERLGASRGLRVANVFHAGDGNLHPLILFDGRRPGAVERAEELAGEILDLCVRLGGSITGEHGVGMEKREHLTRMFGRADFAAMRRLRRAIDPHELANRGKMLLSEADERAARAATPARRHDDAVAASAEVRAIRDAIHEAREAGRRVLPRGAGSKPALSTPHDGDLALEMGALNGIVRHDPAELTVTALAGTPIRELAQALADHGQYLPFDPPFGPLGATVGGVVAAGTSGPGRHRHGGIRDFVIGARFLDGTGELVTGGARVVKNAAGFDLPKLLTGSLGRLGAIVEVSLKVLPAPPAWGTLHADAAGLPQALEAIARLGRSGIDVEALDLEPPARIWVRLGGPVDGLASRLDRVERELGLGGDRLMGSADSRAWADARELAWAPAGAALAKVATRPGQIPELESALADADARGRYSAGGNLCWLAWPRAADPDALDRVLRELGAFGVWTTGTARDPLVGAFDQGALASRATSALDPDGVFAEL